MGNKPQFNFEKYSIEVDEIMDEAAKVERELTAAPEKIGLFTAKPANSWIREASKRPIPKMLFSEFWFEGEVCILFADTGNGKSILAVQIGDSISSGRPIPGIKLEASKQKVLYFDFELSDKQFEARYSNEYKDHYQFDDNFIRVEIDPEANMPEGQDMEAYLYASLESTVITAGAKVLIVDNLTYLKNETEKAKDALPLMKHLKALKKKHGLSILALAHTPKRDLSKPLTRNDLQGSKMLINFCDSSFAIGESHSDTNIRYLKQIKERYTEKLYGIDNVCVCQIVKPVNCLQFEFMRFSRESEHLREPSDKDSEATNELIQQLHKQGKSLREIADEVKLSHMTVARRIKNIKVE